VGCRVSQSWYFGHNLTNFDIEVILSAGKYFPNMLKIYEMFISMLFGTRIRRKKSFCGFWYFGHILMSFDFKVILSVGKCFPNVFNIYGMLRSM
jgi:hypothetical protein